MFSVFIVFYRYPANVYKNKTASDYCPCESGTLKADVVKNINMRQNSESVLVCLNPARFGILLIEAFYAYFPDIEKGFVYLCQKTKFYCHIT